MLQDYNLEETRRNQVDKPYQSLYNKYVEQ